MQEKWGKDGFVGVTVNLNYSPDPALSKEKYKENALGVLQKKKVDAINLLLDENDEAMVKKLRLEAFPAVYVFDRQGRWTPFKAVEGAKEASDKEIEAFVEKLVKEK